jgi:hypothetical protein
MPNTITSANAQFTLSVPGVLPVPVPIEGFAADDAFDTENVAPNEAIMGVDGNLSGGYTPYPVKLKFVLQADSPSIAFMDQWLGAMKTATETYQANATIVAPSLGKIYTFLIGFLTGAIPTAPGKKVFQPQTYEITFESVSAAPV